jgi:cytosine deaminase
MDDISDAYYPYGRNNMLEVAFLVSHLLWMTTREDMEALYDMITTLPAKAIGLQNFNLKKGSPANLVVLAEPNVLEALRNHDAPAYVFSHGKLVDQEKVEELAIS